MPFIKTRGYRFDRFSSKAEAHLICKLFKDFKIVPAATVQRLKYQQRLIRDYECVKVPKDKVWQESDCDYGVFYAGKTCQLSELKKKLKPVLALYSKKEIAMYFKSLTKEK
jgi:hypothetical protein